VFSIRRGRGKKGVCKGFVDAKFSLEKSQSYLLFNASTKSLDPLERAMAFLQLKQNCDDLVNPLEPGHTREGSDLLLLWRKGSIVIQANKA
jgi:hypothetical protein